MGETQGKGPQAGQLDTGFPLRWAPTPRSDSVRLPPSHQLPKGALDSHGGRECPSGDSLDPARDLCPLALITTPKPSS